jgi:hypothetical protein
MTMSTQQFAVRAGAPSHIQASNFGPLNELAGNWVGSGFNLISRPGQDVNLPFVLQVNATKEVLTFDPVNGAIPDRGSVQGDINIFAMTYLQQVSDATTNGLLHIERGMWLNVPASSDPNQPTTVVRLATIPHGDSVLAQGSSISHPGDPQILPVSPTPFNPQTGEPIGPGYFPPPFTPPNTVTGPLPPGFDIGNPNAALTAAIQGQTITNTIVLQISTSTNPTGFLLPGPFGGGLLNIPFVTTNANALSLDATFWIETVVPPNGQPFLQLQYTQTVILTFGDINWPHISVATLLKN